MKVFEKITGVFELAGEKSLSHKESLFGFEAASILSTRLLYK